MVGSALTGVVGGTSSGVAGDAPCAEARPEGCAEVDTVRGETELRGMPAARSLESAAALASRMPSDELRHVIVRALEARGGFRSVSDPEGSVSGGEECE